MGSEPQHARNCPAVWRGFYVTLFERIPEDAPCVCGTNARAAARESDTEVELPARAA